jgi:hypothetical protein
MMCCLPSRVLAFLDIDMEYLTIDSGNPEGWIHRMSEPLAGIHMEGAELRLLAKLVRQVLSISFKIYFDALESEMRS